MVAESFTNFSTTLLVTASINATATSFAVTAGQGTLFPLTNFLITMDSEVMLIASRATDTFTVASGGRGYDNTTAATHTSGATIQLAVCAYNMKHLWQNVADTYGPQVPPAQVGGSASSYDNEFETAGSWVLSPSASGSTTFSINTNLRSHLLLNRVAGDNTTYVAYVPFAQSGSFTITAKVSDGAALTDSSQYDQAQCQLFVSDQVNPTAGADTGNRFKVNLITTLHNTDSGATPCWATSSTDVSGVASSSSQQFTLARGTPRYLRITYDGSGNWSGFVGDGITYDTLFTKSGFSFTPATLGITFWLYRPTGFNPSQVVAVDYVRVVVGTILGPYGS